MIGLRFPSERIETVIIVVRKPETLQLRVVKDQLSARPSAVRLFPLSIVPVSIAKDVSELKKSIKSPSGAETGLQQKRWSTM